MSLLARTARAIAGSGVAALVVAIVAMMIVPLPTWLLDVLLTTNLALSVTVLLAALSSTEALALSTFPTLLVLTTLYRLALAVSTTRLILLQANAGQVVRAFGSFVVRGDYLVGAAVFVILTLVQYLVIARGAERVAEVAARFTLDALPGKQLAIDGDLRGGTIDAEEARRRRQGLTREAQVYGALDGAMRFVKGDAIAGILILVVSLVGGLAIGTLEHGMPLGEAARLYTLLTIGDGLVSQLPALLLATAAGLVVTRAGAADEGETLERAIARQIVGRPRALAIVAAMLFALALLPGLPLVPFLVVALPMGGLALWLSRRPAAASAESHAPVAPPAVEVALDPALSASIGGEGLAAALDAAARALVDELGLPLPGVARTVDAQLPPRSYEVRLRGVPLADGHCPDGKLLAEASATRLAPLGVAAEATPHPSTGAPAAWVPAKAAPALEVAGVPLRDARGCVAAALDGTLRRHAHELLGYDETQRLLDALARSSPALVREVVPRRVDVATLTDVLRRLLGESVPIGDLRDVLEALAQVAPTTPTAGDPSLLVERVRAQLRRHITRRLARGKQIDVLVLDPIIEEAVRDAIRPTQTGPVLALEPALAEDILAALERSIAARREEGAPVAHPVIVTSAELRRHVRRLVEREHPEVAVVTYQELNPDVRVEPVGRIAVG